MEPDILHRVLIYVRPTVRWLKHFTNTLPLRIIHQSEQTTGIDYEFVQEREHTVEAWPLFGLLLPAVQHQLVQCHGTAYWCWQTVAFFN